MKTKPVVSKTNVSPEFLKRFGPLIQGTLCGFDRLRLRGTLRHLFQPTVMEAYLNACRVLIKDFGRFAEGITQRLKAATYQLAERAKRPVIYLNSSQQSKEGLAREIAARDKIAEGLIVILSCVESCMSYSVRGDRQSKEIHLVLEPRKCLFFYHYFHHPIFGFMHVRVQSWFPFTVDLCLNGRHWLARQLDQQGISYRQRDNCFVWVSDWAKAQSLLREQCHFKWKAPLTFLLHQVNPLVSEICRPIRQSYYWTASETEYATDLAFAQPEELAKLYPRFVHHGISSFASPDVMRFLGRWTPTTTGRVYGQFDGQIISDLKHRSEGIRVKHSLNGNSIKVYDKQGSVLRVETTINKPAEFKVYRAKENDPQGPLAWRELRRGLADLPRRAEVSHQSNNRYLSALASVTGTTALAKVVAKVCVPRTFQGRRHRALRPWSPEDQAFLEAIGRGEFTVNGFRNRDLRRLLHPQRASSQKQRRQAAAIGRKLRLLRIHGLVRKVSGTHRYVVTDGGRQILTALACARNADVDQLTKMAA